MSIFSRIFESAHRNAHVKMHKFSPGDPRKTARTSLPTSTAHDFANGLAEAGQSKKTSEQKEAISYAYFTWAVWSVKFKTMLTSKTISKTRGQCGPCDLRRCCQAGAPKSPRKNAEVRAARQKKTLKCTPAHPAHVNCAPKKT